MGYSCRKENILKLLTALEAVLIYHGVRINRGEGAQAALNMYGKQKSKVSS
jgi:(S)-ureidoglycine-glyoxylate aminotransferase